MALPSFLKSPYIMGSAGVVGVGSVSAASLSGGGSGIDYSREIQQNSENRRNLIASFQTASILGTKCFDEFFGKENKVSSSVSGFSVDSSLSAPEKPSVSGWSESPVGCTYIQFAEKGDETFMFQTETTVKNDKVGLALFSLGRNVETSTYETNKPNALISKTGGIVQYYLFFLEKSDDKNWSIKGGYSWQDVKLAYGFQDRTIHLKSPGGNINVNKKYSGITGSGEYKDDEWNHKMYFGRWKGDNHSGKEVFEDIEVWGDDKGSAEILGRDYSNTFEATKGNKGYDTRGDASPVALLYKYEYKVGTSNWHSRNELKASTLDSWYAPFGGKKGTWIEQKVEGNA